ncbi:F-box protein [Aspergillus mulundensis]|uniref:Leucine-rich repeat domain-containing protein n=1 Tax=Aspergillus mulundensis TaxID=1810919 RepID=A0A3D8T492_9EURO|nr:hypothetical protein DSM5745_00704 [Aspergillus mulundensis]RDW93382.1 hypothetical protein DSM5745_00704 [Aspergillus mulundensis]
MLSTLPAEILLLIAGYLTRRSDILSIASCSRRCHALLYPQVLTGLHYHKRFIKRQLYRLIRLVTQNPRLAKAVRVLRPTERNGFEPFYDIQYDRDTIRSLLKAAASASAIEESEVLAWEMKLRNINGVGMGLGPWFALLLSLLPNLKELALSVERPWCEDTHRILRKAIENPGSHIFSRLEKLRLDIDFSYAERADGLELHSTLESFTYQYMDTIHNTPKDVINPSSFYEPLYKHRESIEEIAVHYYEWVNGNTNFGHTFDLRFVGSFVDFPVLKKLRMTGYNILDWVDPWTPGNGARNTLLDVLPRSLEALTIEGYDRCDYEYFTAELEKLVRDAETHWPNLAVLQIQEYFQYEGNHRLPEGRGPYEMTRTWLPCAAARAFVSSIGILLMKEPAAGNTCMTVSYFSMERTSASWKLRAILWELAAGNGS